MTRSPTPTPDAGRRTTTPRMAAAGAVCAGLALAALATLAATAAPAAPAAPAAAATEDPMPAAATKAAPLDYEGLAGRIAAQLALQPGEKVLLVADPAEFRELVAPLRAAVVRSGGVDLGCWTVMAPPAGLDPAALARAGAASRAALRVLLRNVDAAVMMPGASPENPEYAAMEDVLHEGHGRTVHFHWRGGGAPSAIPVPGHPPPSAAAIDAAYQRAVLHSDCRAIGEVQRRFAAALAAGALARISTPEGTDLRFRAGDRPVNFQDGDASAARAARARVLVDREIELPCGALRLAPLEESVEGTIAFPPASWNDREVGAVTLRFAHGRVVEVTPRPGPAAAATREAVEAELAAGGPAARSFREFALGFNPELAVPETDPWIPYYGYGAGVVRLSLGDNSELGGRVQGAGDSPYVRWNFFVDTTVEVGGRSWVRAGKLTPPPAP